VSQTQVEIVNFLLSSSFVRSCTLPALVAVSRLLGKLEEHERMAAERKAAEARRRGNYGN
jgi:hypothetical protein